MMEWDQAPELRLRFEALHKVGASRTIKGISEGSFQSVIWMQTAGEDHGSLKWIGGNSLLRYVTLQRGTTK